MTEKSDLDLFSQWKRELQSVEVEGFGAVYFYSPPSFGEMKPYANAVMNGQVADGVLDSLIARVKRADGKPRWLKHHRSQLEQLPASALSALWQAIGGADMASPDELAEGAEKK